MNYCIVDKRTPSLRGEVFEADTTGPAVARVGANCSRGRGYCRGHLSLRLAFYGLDRGRRRGQELRYAAPGVCCRAVNMPCQVGPTPKLGPDFHPKYFSRHFRYFRSIHISIAPKSNHLMMWRVLTNQVQIRFNKRS